MSLTKVPSSMTSFEGTTFNGEVRSYDSADQGNFVGGASGTANRIQICGASHPSTPNVITMDTNGSEKLRIDSSGSLLVGTTSTDIFAARVTGFGVGPSLAGGQYLNVRSSLNAKWGLTSTSGAHFYFYSDNGSAAVLSGSIYSNGSSTSFNTSSDYRLKEDYQPVTDAIARLNQLNPLNFDCKVNVSWSVYDINLDFSAFSIFPETSCSSRSNCNTSFLLLFHPVHCSSAIVNLTNFVRNTCVIQNSFLS